MPSLFSYYMDGRVSKVEDFLKTRLLDTLTEQITKVTKVLDFPVLKKISVHIQCMFSPL